VESFMGGGEESLDVTCEFNIFFDAIWFWGCVAASSSLGPGSLVVSLVIARMRCGLPGCGLSPDSGEPVPAFFARERLDVGVERTGLRTPTTGRLPTI